MYLPNSVVVSLTKKVRFKAQCRALDRLRITYRLADNGEPLVRESDLDGPKTRHNGGPRWDRIGL